MLETFAEALRGSWYSAIGTTASLLSLLLTGFVLWNLRRIKKHYIFTARSPDLIERLRKHASQISTYLNDPEGFESETSVELARMEATLLSLQRVMARPHKWPIRDLLETVRSNELSSTRRRNSYYKYLLKIREKNKDSTLRIVYLETVKLVEQLDDIQEEQRWDR